MAKISNSARFPSSAVALALMAGIAAGQNTSRVSVSSSGAQGNFFSNRPAVSADGRFVAFSSAASTLVPVDSNGLTDVFVRDRLNGTTELASVSSTGQQGNGFSGDFPPSLSADGRFVAFTSTASDFVGGDTLFTFDVFVHDRQTGTTECVSLDPGGVPANGGSTTGVISADGRFVAFLSSATNLVAGDTNNLTDVFVRDRQTGAIELVSVDSNGVQANFAADDPAISADGRFVAWESYATNLVPGDTNGSLDVFVHDRQTGATERVSQSSGGMLGNGHSQWPSLSADGRFVAFSSLATNLVSGDSNGWQDVFVHDRQTGFTERASVDSGGAQADYDSLGVISADGRFVVFSSGASNLVAGDTNAAQDVFEHDRQTGATRRISVDSLGFQANGGGGEARCSPDGRYVVFSSNSTNLVAGDTNGQQDVFLRDASAVPPGVDLCQPGSGGVAACPCSNPAVHTPGGCDNSSGTGGAQLASCGAAALGYDSLVFITSNERTSANSIVLQGNAAIASGLVYGQGVRCLGGSLLRLYGKTASGGSITAPGPGDASVSARSSALGDPIGAGTSRWYAVYYRDPTVLGGCPSASMFSITQTQLVNWTL